MGTAAPVLDPKPEAAATVGLAVLDPEAVVCAEVADAAAVPAVFATEAMEALEALR